MLRCSQNAVVVIRYLDVLFWVGYTVRSNIDFRFAMLRAAYWDVLII
ncbi:MAG: hypothetical protein RIR55_18 [Bacteroidota bacterium]